MSIWQNVLRLLLQNRERDCRSLRTLCTQRRTLQHVWLVTIYQRVCELTMPMFGGCIAAFSANNESFRWLKATSGRRRLFCRMIAGNTNSDYRTMIAWPEDDANARDDIKLQRSFRPLSRSWERRIENTNSGNLELRNATESDARDGAFPDFLKEPYIKRKNVLATRDCVNFISREYNVF